MPEPLSPARLAEIRDLNVDSCSADAPYNPDVWALEKARTDLLAEVDRLRTPPPPGELRGLDAMCAALHSATETDPVVKEVAWRTFALIRAHREQSAEVDRLKAENAALRGSHDQAESRIAEALDLASRLDPTSGHGRVRAFISDLRRVLSGEAS